MQWNRADHIQPRQFVSGYCGDKVASKALRHREPRQQLRTGPARGAVPQRRFFGRLLLRGRGALSSIHPARAAAQARREPGLKSHSK